MGKHRGVSRAYRKTKNYTKAKWKEASDGLMTIFAEFAEYKNSVFAAASPEMQSLVGKLQDYITQNYCTCTNEILVGLGRMYVCDERYRCNIDKCGEGAAAFAAEAIELFCSKNTEMRRLSNERFKKAIR